MAAPKRTRIQRERDLVIVSDLYLRGETQQAIAGIVSESYPEFSLTQQQIGYDIKKLLGRWQKQQFLNIDDIKARELARINKMEREAWDAWDRSKEDAETTISKVRGATGDKEPKQVERTEQAKGQVGNPAFMKVIQWCVEQRCKIFGAYAAEKRDITTDGEKWPQPVIMLPPVDDE